MCNALIFMNVTQSNLKNITKKNKKFMSYEYSSYIT